MSEIYHYPLLCVGWFGMFITAMNMIPIGQLDGGHISFAMFGEKRSYNIALISFGLLFISGFLAAFRLLLVTLGADINHLSGFLGYGWLGWMIWALVLFFVIKIKHPPIYDDTELNPFRMFLGYLSYVILIISFSPVPFSGPGI
jgi:membrane-associated protease RseP (regulator of RpoE activity)